MIKPTSGLSPIYVRYWDNGEATVYNMTEDQYNILYDDESNTSTELLEKFEVEQDYPESSYVQPFMRTLSKIYGFEVDSE